jgi:hypothetical protein
MTGHCPAIRNCSTAISGSATTHPDEQHDCTHACGVGSGSGLTLTFAGVPAGAVWKLKCRPGSGLTLAPRRLDCVTY